MLKHLIAFAIVLFAATPAFALLPPQYYEQARAEAADVVVIAVERVTPLPMGRGLGDCQVRGRVTAVERGTRYRVGQRINVAVPCVRPNAETPSSGVIYQEMNRVRAARAARAWLNNGALALYQYEILATR